MLILIILLPLIGSLFFLHIEENTSSQSNYQLITRNNSNNYNDMLLNEVKKNSIIKQIGLSTSLITLILTIYLFSQMNNNTGLYQFGYSAGLPLAVDGISIYYVLLTAFITPICLLSNWRDITIKRKYFVFAFLLLETLQITFFLVVDLLLFYIYFESVLIPLFLIIGVWGASQARTRAAFLMFLYTLAGSLPMLLAILFIKYNLGTTDFNELKLIPISPETQTWLGFAFLLSFAVKAPLYPFHLWLFRAHAEAPLAGSILLASIILKFATYGFLRIMLTFLPDFTAEYGYIIQAMAIITLVYASLVTLRQIDTKALVAYSSVAHMAVCILGLFSNTITGIEGAILLSLAHGLVSPALFIIVGGILYNRYHTRIINYYRGLTLTMPIFSIIFFLFTVFNASAPLSLNFVGEFLSLLGIFTVSPVIGFIASSGIIFSALYSIFLFNRIAFLSFSPYFNKKTVSKYTDNDLNRLEIFLMLPLLFLTIIFGLFPNLILDTLHHSVTNLLYSVDNSLNINEFFIDVFSIGAHNTNIFSS